MSKTVYLCELCKEAMTTHMTTAWDGLETAVCDDCLAPPADHSAWYALVLLESTGPYSWVLDEAWLAGQGHLLMGLPSRRIMTSLQAFLLLRGMIRSHIDE